MTNITKTPIKIAEGWDDDERSISFLKHDTITRETWYINSLKTPEIAKNNRASLSNIEKKHRKSSHGDNFTFTKPTKHTEPIDDNSNLELEDEEIITTELDCEEDDCEAEELNAEIFDKQVYSKFMYQ